jgi:hypothetical protein
LLLQEPLPPADPIKALFGDSSDSDEDVVADTQRAAAASSVMPAMGRMVPGLRAPQDLCYSFLFCLAYVFLPSMLFAVFAFLFVSNAVIFDAART